MSDKARRPLIYSCSGCSSVAQLANHVAVTLHRTRQADMSCIAGLGGDVPALVKLAKSGRPIAALDGCPLNCVKHTLARHGLEPDVHLTLTELGLSKRARDAFDPEEAARVLSRTTDLLEGLATAS